ncbi:unnamed protein product [Mytilus coruscus]|uniref:Uncharacterized protein n=1 Tax=Mytilus coruscus TaxID=42192 RepID=A0A6J8EHL6_MYTCO|nr:unnamed protein product [Mytilus coruscus]
MFPSHIPTWITGSHRRGAIPGFVLNTLIHKRIILLSQVEGTHEISSHECSLSIRKVIYALMLGTGQCVKEHNRQKTSLFEFQRSGVICITGVLGDLYIPNMSRELKIKILSDPPINANFLKSVLICYILFSAQGNEFCGFRIDIRDDDIFYKRNSHTDGRKGANGKGLEILYSKHLHSDVRLTDLYSEVCWKIY